MKIAIIKKLFLKIMKSHNTFFIHRLILHLLVPERGQTNAY